MFICSEEYNKISETIRYYISKFIKIGNDFMDEFNIRDFDIQKVNEDLYRFTYDASFGEKLNSDERYIIGTISKSCVKLIAKKTVSAFKSGNFVSFTTIKMGEFEAENGLANYSDLYATISSRNNDEKIESIRHHQKYNFKTGNIDLLNNYANLIPIKWPIIKHDASLVKKI